MVHKNNPDGPKTIHIALAFIYVVNYCLGVGFLGIPYAFYYSGYLAAIPTLLCIVLISWITANYLVECMARAQALESFRLLETQSNYSESKDNFDFHPKFEITNRKFELVEMFELFYGKWAKILYLFVLTIYSFLILWPFSTVAGSAWASNIPFNFSTVQQCAEDDFQHAILPPEPCLGSYYVSLSIFGVIVILISLLNLKEQAILQITLGAFRFVTIGAIVVYCIVNIAFSGNRCMVSGLPSVNETPFTMMNTTDSSPIRLFNFVGWISSVPIFTYAIGLHIGIPSLTQPVRQKQYIHWLVAATLVTIGICYFALGLFVSLWFNADIQENCTLNWGELTKPSSSLALRILSYTIILFPSLDVVSAYPLNVHVIANNIYVIITGKDTSEKPTHRFTRYDFLFRLVLRLICASVPVLMAFGVANFIIVAKYAGLLGLIVIFGSPVALQLRSIYVCKKTFANILRKRPVEIKLVDSVQETASQLPSSSRNMPLFYMTPYSNRLFSHPVAVCVFGVAGSVSFCLIFTSLFLSQETEVCSAEVKDMLFNDY